MMSHRGRAARVCPAGRWFHRRAATGNSLLGETPTNPLRATIAQVVICFIIILAAEVASHSTSVDVVRIADAASDSVVREVIWLSTQVTGLPATPVTVSCSIGTVTGVAVLGTSCIVLSLGAKLLVLAESCLAGACIRNCKIKKSR